MKGIAISCARSASRSVTHGALLNSAYNPAEDDNVAALSFARSGDSFIDSLGGADTKIITPTAYLSGTTSRIRILSSAIGIQGGALWDVTFKFKMDDYTRRNPLFYNGGNSNSNKGITIMPYGTNLIIYSSDGTNAYRTATINCGFQSNVDYTLRFQWSGITDEIMTITVNGSVFTTSSNRGWDGAPSPLNTDFGAYADAFYYKGIYRSVVGTLGGVAMDFHPTGLISNREYDTSVPNRLLTFSATNTTSVYDGNSSYYFDYGYSIQKRTIGGTLFYVPNDIFGNTVVPVVSGGSSVVSEIVGNATKHNLYLSYLEFDDIFFDRSNVSIWNDACRISAYYDVANPKRFHIDEINLQTIRSYLNANYRGMFFPVFSETSVDDRTFMEGFILSSVDKIGASEIAVLNYTKDIRRAQRNIDNIYITDTDGYLSIYQYNDLGENPEGNFTKYQSLIDVGDTVIGKGLTKYDVILISQPLKIPSNRTVTINCELRIKKAAYSNLTDDVKAGDTVIKVADSSEFSIGEYIAISDAILPWQGGGTVRKVAACGVITDKAVDSITINYNSEYNVSSTNSGKIGHCQPVILIENVTNVLINGSGIINVNKANQYDVECVWHNVEAVEFGSGISVIRSTNCKILSSSEILVKNAVLHNIVFSGGLYSPNSKINGEIGKVRVSDAHDKNILLAETDGINAHDIITHDATYEDGIAAYLNNVNFTLTNIIAYDNGRVGINVLGNGVCNGIINNVISSDSIYLLSSNIAVSDIEMLDNAFLLITSQYSGGKSIVINNLTFNKVTQSRLIAIEGDVSDIEINNCNIDQCVTSLAAIHVDDYLSGGVFPLNIRFNGGGIYNHTGTKTAIDASADVIFTDFDGLP